MLSVYSTNQMLHVLSGPFQRQNKQQQKTLISFWQCFPHITQSGNTAQGIVLKIFNNKLLYKPQSRKSQPRFHPPTSMSRKTWPTLYEESTNEILPLFLPPKAFEWARESVIEPKLTAGIQSFTERREGGEATIKARCDVLLYFILLFSVDSGNVSHITSESCCVTCGTTEVVKYSEYHTKLVTQKCII